MSCRVAFTATSSAMNLATLYRQDNINTSELSPHYSNLLSLRPHHDNSHPHQPSHHRRSLRARAPCLGRSVQVWRRSNTSAFCQPCHDLPRRLATHVRLIAHCLRNAARTGLSALAILLAQPRRGSPARQGQRAHLLPRRGNEEQRDVQGYLFERMGIGWHG
jgi:hypothetical protein